MPGVALDNEFARKVAKLSRASEKLGELPSMPDQIAQTYAQILRVAYAAGQLRGEHDALRSKLSRRSPGLRSASAADRQRMQRLRVDAQRLEASVGHVADWPKEID